MEVFIAQFSGYQFMGKPVATKDSRVSSLYMQAYHGFGRRLGFRVETYKKNKMLIPYAWNVDVHKRNYDFREKNPIKRELMIPKDEYLTKQLIQWDESGMDMLYIVIGDIDELREKFYYVSRSSFVNYNEIGPATKLTMKIQIMVKTIKAFKRFMLDEAEYRACLKRRDVIDPFFEKFLDHFDIDVLSVHDYVCITNPNLQESTEYTKLVIDQLLPSDF